MQPRVCSGATAELHADRASGGTAPGHGTATQWYDTSGNANHGTLTDFGFALITERTNLCTNPRLCVDSNADGLADTFNGGGSGTDVHGTIVYSVSASGQRIQYTGVPADSSNSIASYVGNGASAITDFGLVIGDRVEFSALIAATYSGITPSFGIQWWTAAWGDAGSTFVEIASGTTARYAVFDTVPADTVYVGFMVSNTYGDWHNGDTMDLTATDVLMEETVGERTATGGYFCGFTDDCLWSGTADASTSLYKCYSGWVSNNPTYLATDRTNRCTDPSFEKTWAGGPDWYYPDLWSGCPWGVAKFREVFSPVDGGSACEILRTTTADLSCGQMFESSPAREGEWWSASAYLWGNNNGQTVTLECGFVPSYTYTTVNVTLTDTPTRYWVCAAAPAGTTAVRLLVRAVGTNPNTALSVRFDQVVLERSAAVGDYFDGFTDDCSWTGTANASTSVHKQMSQCGPSALSFTAASTTNYVNLPDLSLAEDKTVSYEAWFRTTLNPLSPAAVWAIVGEDNEGVSAWEASLCLYAGYCYARVVDASYASYINTNLAPVSDGEWHHAVMTWGGSNKIALYVDGVLVQADIAGPSTTPVITHAHVGKLQNDSWLAGEIKVARYYPFALTPDQVATNYAAGMAWNEMLGASAGPTFTSPFYFRIGAFDIPVTG